MIDLAFQHCDLAGAAQPVTAGMRQPDAGAQAGVENGLPFLHRHCLPDRLDRQPVHRSPCGAGDVRSSCLWDP